ncbi:Glycine betaine/carnitine/choline-binding protein OpuCC [Moorella humiferrea]|uniref:Glycine betaine/carnitine/choline-binding protein OpuCC n=2 Tax=Neomoorella humiferrea TaxID=676965 RepID=A0A2T0AY62_9FIRM|nr:glycine betaine ABC transporter substrate-binding protein [Moorella humiferrea]PRR75830.1 Glycine betaine/carnitine/choline-binding protein OpuCC precursor [Moorella humiferrea]
MHKKTARVGGKFFALVMSFTILLLGIVGCGGGPEVKDTVVVGSKDFTENIILGEIMAQLIEAHTDLKVERKLNLGGTLVNFNALKKGDLDLYADYTGTGLVAILKKDVINDPQKAYDTVQKEYNEQLKLKWLKPFGFNNTYTLAVREEVAQQRNLQKISDLKNVASEMVFGAEQEFFNRPDGYDGLIATYGLNFKSAKQMETGLKYEAIGNKMVDIIDAFSTDGQLITYNLKILEDDKHFFPPYFAAPLVRMDTLEKYPQLEEVLNKLAGQLNDDEMRQLNYQVDEEKKEVAQVARDFLKKKSLIE